MVKEIRRTCRNCGTVWHSLPSREGALMLRMTGSAIGGLGEALQSCGTCGMCGGSVAQRQRNVDANISELDRLRRCPVCGSSNYSEEVLEYR